jgi:hypothetical protein
MSLARLNKFFAAIAREGRDFGFDSWRRELEQERLAQQNAESAQASEQPVAAPTAAGVHSGPRNSPVVHTQVVAQRATKPSSGPEKKSIQQKLEELVEAFEASQEDRRRTAIYQYLGAVLRLVRHFQVKRRIKRLIWAAEKFSGLRAPADIEPFGFVIRCTADRDVVNDQLRSKWSRALRFAARFKRRESLRRFARRYGGLNGLAARYTTRLGTRSRKARRAGKAVS